MSSSKSFLLYEDEPAYDLFLKLIIVIVPAGLLTASFYLWSSGEPSGGLALLAETLLISLIFWIVFVDNANRAMSQWARIRGKLVQGLPSHS